MTMKNKVFLGIVFFFLLIGSTVFGSFSENSRQGSEPVFSINHQGIELLNPAPDLGSEGTDGKTRVRLNNLAKVLTPYLFTGRRLDSFSQTYNHRNRQYNPKYGRWLSRDPIGFDGGNNLWNYVGNNPVRFNDPSGLILWPTDPAEQARLEKLFQQNKDWAEQEARKRVQRIQEENAKYYQEHPEELDELGRQAYEDIRNFILSMGAIECPSPVGSKLPKGWGNIGSHGPMSESSSLERGLEWLGSGYREMGPKGSGVFRSADGLRQFRITNPDLLGTHGNMGSHVHFEALDQFGHVIENLHIPLVK
jgi:RHS repeat-associated protein